MYLIIKTDDGAVIGNTEKPIYIYKKSTGCFVIADEQNAQGVAYKGTSYNLRDREGVGADETVIVVEYDGGDDTMQAESASVVASIAFVTLAEGGSIDDVTAGEHVNLFSSWAAGVRYETGNIRAYWDKLYRCLQGHVSQEDWTPDAAASLWALIADPAEEWPAWSQPVGAHDAYDIGDQVSHNGKHWTSDVGGNVWEPGVYGWTEKI